MIFLLVVCTLMVSGNSAKGQVKIGKIISGNQITSYQDNHLVLIDFWATWCAPCINIGKQLENTQEIYKDNLTVISLSNENESTVRQFVEKHHPRLTIAVDDQNQTFDHFGVNRSLPYSVLLNPKGTVLWKGHPADLSFEMIERFIRENKGVAGRKKPKFITVAREREDRPIVPEKDAFSVVLSQSEDAYFIVSEEGVEFHGRSSRLFSEILRKPVQAIRVEDDRVVKANISMLNWEQDHEVLLNMVLGELKMLREVVTEATVYYKLTVRNQKMLWDDKQISLGSYNGAYMVGEDNLSVDNATVRDFAFRFSAYMEHPVYTEYDSPVLHDWLVHYKYFDLTREQLSTEYGVNLELKKGKHEVIVFR